MSRLVATGLAVLLVAPWARAAEANFERGQAAAERAKQQFEYGLAARDDRATARKWFEAAAYSYRDAWMTDAFRTRPCSLNQGRAWLLAGHPQAAIRAFHDGLAEYPADADLLRGLEAARAAVNYPAETDPAQRIRPDPFTGLRYRVSPTRLFLASAMSSLLLAAGLAARFTTRPAWAMPAASVGILGIIAIAVTWWQIRREADADRTFPVLVLHHDTPLRTGNGTSYPPRLDTPLPLGAEVRRLHRRGGWVQVEVPGGAVGWLPDAAVMAGTIE